MSWWSAAKDRQRTTNSYEVELLKRLIANQHYITNRMEAISSNIETALANIQKTAASCQHDSEDKPTKNR